MADNSGKERSYVAFISYRHTPLDREAAERVQKKIENYTVPKEFREKVGGKKLGLCFRDEDELPASSSLTDSIYYALDHTKFLIVICTPNLPMSKWCEAEIRYFLKTHDRDHILAVLADGDPAESFSPYMLHDYDENGQIIRDREPLAANIAGPDHSIDNKAFKKEIVRLYAALIGCPFDELWQRERRARTRRLGAAVGAAFAVMAVFLGVVLNRNAQIEERNRQITAQNDQITQQNDRITEQNTELQKQMSSVLVDAGLDKLSSHDTAGAVTDALDALESGDPEVYDHRADKLLADALGIYMSDQRTSKIVYTQASEIADYRISDDGKAVLVLDTEGVLKCLETGTWNKQWEVRVKGAHHILYTEKLADRVIVTSTEGAFGYSVENGELLWSFEHQEVSKNAFSCLKEDGTVLTLLDQTYNGETYDNRIVFLDSLTGKEKGSAPLDAGDYEISASSFDGPPLYAGAFSENGTKFACALPASYHDENDEYTTTHLIYLIDAETYESQGVLTSDTFSMFFGLCCYDDREDVFVAAYSVNSGSVRTILCTKGGSGYEFDSQGTSHDMKATDGGLYRDYNTFGENHCSMLVNGPVLILISDNRIFFYDRYTNTCRRTYALHDVITNAFWLDKEEMVLEIVTAGGWMLGYEVGTDDTVIESLNGYNADQTDLKNGLPVNGGFILWKDGAWADNFDEGACLTLSESAPSSLMLLEAVSDPGRQKIEPSLEEEDSYFNGLYFLPGCRDVLAAYGKEPVMLSRSDQTVTGQGCIESFASYDGITLLDEKSFVSGNTRYSLDGAAEDFVEPVPVDDFTQARPYSHIYREDETLMSYGETAYTGIISRYHTGYLSASIYPLWLDGVPLDSSFDPQTALVGCDDDTSACYAGECGYLLYYGKRIICGEETVSIDETAGFSFLDSRTGDITTVGDPASGTALIDVAMGHIKPMAAVSYEDGSIRLLTPDGTAETWETPFGTGEIKAAAFSDDDRYLAVLTSAGAVSVFETESGSQAAVLTAEELREYADSSSPILTVQTIPGEDRLVILALNGSFSSKGFGLVVDSASWIVTREITDMTACDPEYKKIYAYRNRVLVAYPFHDLDDLKAIAQTTFK